MGVLIYPTPPYFDIFLIRSPTNFNNFPDRSTIIHGNHLVECIVLRFIIITTTHTITGKGVYPFTPRNRRGGRSGVVDSALMEPGCNVGPGL